MRKAQAQTPTIAERAETLLYRRGTSALLWHLLLAGLSLAVFWLPPRFLTQDGPAHLDSASVYRRLVRATPECCLLQPWPPPNSLGAWTGALLLPVVGPVYTEKTWATLSLVSMAAGGAWLASALRPGAPGTGIYLFALHPFLFAGFWNFNLALGLFLLSLGTAVRLRSRPALSRAAALLLWGGLLYFSHLFVFVLLVLALLPLCLAAPVASWAERRGAQGGRRWLAVAALLGGAAAAAQFWMLRPAWGGDWTARLSAWPFPWPLMGWYGYGEQVVVPLLQAVVLALALVETARARDLRSVCLLLAGLLVLFAVVPDQIGAGMAVKGRVWVLAGLAAAVFLPSIHTGRLGILCVALLVWHLWNVLPRQREWNLELESLLAASSRMNRGEVQASLMGAYWEDSSRSVHVLPLLHADLLLALGSGGWSLSNPQMGTPEFPVQYRSRFLAQADRLTGLALRRESSVERIAAAVETSAARYVVVQKQGGLPWPPLAARWRTVHETPRFLVLDVRASPRRGG